MMNEPRLLRQVELHPYPLLFVTISGAHLYGFPSPDSDFDLHGVHVLPVREVVGLDTGPETILQISAMCCLKSTFPSLETRVGFVVTPSHSPSAAACRISSRLAVSKKNFICVS